MRRLRVPFVAEASRAHGEKPGSFLARGASGVLPAEVPKCAPNPLELCTLQVIFLSDLLQFEVLHSYQQFRLRLDDLLHATGPIR